MLVPPLLRPLSPHQTHISALGLTLGYVGGIYLSNFFFKSASAPKRADKRSSRSAGSPDNKLSKEILEEELITIEPQQRTSGFARNDPDVIVRRIGAVTIATVVGLLGVYKLVGKVFEIEDLPIYALKTTITFLGLSTRLPSPFTLSRPSLSTLTKILSPYLLTPLLFLGPLYCLHLDHELPWQAHGKGWSLLNWAKAFGPFGDGKNGLGVRRGEEAEERVRVGSLRKERLMALRDYVVGPISEELVFRSCVIAVYKLGNAGWRTLVFGTPLWFGVAHAHHAYGRWRENGSTGRAAVEALAVAAFQLTYTTLFGWYAAWLFVKTGSVVPSIASHIFANAMGLPAPQSTLRAFPEKRLAVAVVYALGMIGFVAGLRSS